MQTSWNKVARAGERPVCYLQSHAYWYSLSEPRSLEVERTMGGKLQLKLKKSLRPIANEYCEEKMHEVAEREVSWTSFAW